MSKNKKIFLAIGIVVLVLLGAGTYALTTEDTPKAESSQTSQTDTAAQTTPGPTATTQAPDTATSNVAGRYQEYSEGAVADSQYATTIVFFYAPWCPECRSFKKAITDGQIPDGVQVLEADFDSSTDLKKKYGVTLQSTFVRVNTAGELQKKWVGYGKDKSLTSVLENVQ